MSGPAAGGAKHPGESVPGMGTLGMWFLLAMLAVFFLASLAFYIFARLNAHDWPPPEAPALPVTLWLSTFLLIGSSMTLHFALHSVREGRQAGLRTGLALTLALGVAFLACQVYSWLPLLGVRIQAQTNFFQLAFIMLACLHGLHVIFGLVPLGVITAAAQRGYYTAGAHLPVKHIAMYWHFLDIVWLIIFGVLQGLG